MKQIQITCKGQKYIPISQLKNFQGNLKELKKEQFNKLKNLILKHGFSFPVFVWEGHKEMIDGHQRIFVVNELLKKGYAIGDIPVVEIQAKDKIELAEKLLALNSHFGKMTDEGLYEFINDHEIDFEKIVGDLDLPDIDIGKFLIGYFEEEKEEGRENIKIEDLAVGSLSKEDENTKHLVEFSGGKDSTAMLLMMKEKGVKIDEVIQFSMQEWEWDEMHFHIKQLQKNEKINITVLEPLKSLTEELRKKGFPNQFLRWCTGIKTAGINKYIKEKYPDGNYVIYIGISYDEKERINKPSMKKIKAKFPLVDWKITGETAYQYCVKKGYTWGGMYEKLLTKRMSCWCCPLQRLDDLRYMKNHFPEKWRELMEMQRVSRQSFRLGWNTLFKIEHQFWLEDFEYPRGS